MSLVWARRSRSVAASRHLDAPKVQRLSFSGCSDRSPTPDVHLRSARSFQQMRMVGHVRQKSLDIPEATPIVQEKISTGIAGLF